ncbi:DUF4430 domain-containing protein [Bacillus multifaciens]|uniref:DUF4430 domain-containing protein n=1 Tax=Bacillus multifaciens TaxID=3068506 RepID=UPI0027427BC8|nr:DUF4430 domain-containing protein [Bacillus sp. WLY-B-L8]MDP7978178.1 DUF4430 domain-containing protein [Bacillus sp. WLY-B-L8]
MNMMKWLVLLVFSFSFITGCSQNEVKTDAKVAGKQIEKKEEKKQEEKKQEEQKQEDSKQEQKPAEEQKQEEKQKEEKAAEPSQNQKEQSKVVNEPKETQKQENVQQTQVNPVPAPEPKPEPKSNPEPQPKPKPEVKTVTLSVRDDQGTILGETEVELQDGDTVFKVLGRTLKKKGIQMDYTGSGSGVYVQGINNLYEKSKGAGSGWMYRVNGVAVNKGAGSYKVKQGDKIEWFYSLDYRKEDR